MLQPVWGQISPDGVQVYLTFNTEIITDLMTQQTNDRSKKVLLLLDDLGEDVLHSKEAKPIFHKLIANSRHLNISLVWLCQKMTQAPTFVRSNTDCFISFASLSTRERNVLYDEISTTDKKSFSRMLTESTCERFGTFAATFKDGQLRYYKNLDIIIK